MTRRLTDLIVNTTVGEATKGTSIPEELQNTTVEFSATNDTVVATFKDLPDGYSPKAQLYYGNALAGLMAGRIDVTTTKDSITVKFGTKAADKVEYKLNARVQKDDTKAYTTLATLPFNIKISEV